MNAKKSNTLAHKLFLHEYFTKLAKLLEQWLAYYSFRHDHKPKPFEVAHVDMPGESALQRVHIILPYKDQGRVDLEPTAKERLAVAELVAEFQKVLEDQGIPKEVPPEEIVVVEMTDQYTVALKVSTKEQLGLGMLKHPKQAKQLNELIVNGFQQFLDDEVEDD